MAELPELWKDRTPQRQPLFGHAPSFGVSRDAESVRRGLAPPVRRTVAAPPARYRRRDAFLDRLLSPWGSHDRGTGRLWHRMKCRRGHHEVHGGHSLQLGSEVVFVPRRCRWCDSTAV